MNLRKLIFGNPLKSETLNHQNLPKRKALPIFASDALSSVTYATEEIMLVLILIGPYVFNLSIPIAAVICGLMAIVTLSYVQTIQQYPQGGGSYVVAKENLGTKMGLIAAAALLIDYILTVSVSISAGVRALTSAFPSLIPYTVVICCGAVILMAWANLRGLRESANLFSVPTWIFVVLMLALIAVGCIKLFFGILPKSLPENAGSLKASFDSVGIVLLLRAFSSGCTALTGIEAVANGVPIFQEPKSKNASLVLLMVAGLLAILFLGITFLAYYLGITPNPDESLVSQISRRVLVEPWLYYPIQAATMLVLFLAANTAFNGFPLLASILAKDNYLPQQFSHLGDRLAFSNGIIVLAISSIILLIVFKGSTHSLVPLYAIGVFLCFSLSQAGMVRRWYRLKTKNWELKAIVNGVGAATTTLALLVIVESKLLEGAWLTVGLLVPLFLFLFNKTKIYYQNLSLELRKSLQGQLGDWVRSAVNPQASQVVVLVSRLHRGTFLALKFARSLSPNVIAVTVNTQPKGTAELQLAWEALCIREPLLVLESPFRSVVDPLIRYLDLLDLEKKSPESPIIVVLPEFITSKWWHKLLHNQTAFLLKTALLYRKELQGKTHNRIIVNVPYQVKT